MSKSPFEVIKNSSECAARLGKLTAARGVINTPIFMPVGTQGTVKAISNEELGQIRSEIILSNSYHLYLRPGTETMAEAAGGINRFIGWKNPCLPIRAASDIQPCYPWDDTEGVEFQSHIDGSKHFFTPKSSMEIQKKIGADIIMCFDECSPYPCTRGYAARSMRMSVEWARRCKEAFFEIPGPEYSRGQLLFGIIQGSVYNDLRKESIEKTIAIGFPGYALGGLSVGEQKEEMISVLKPRKRTFAKG